MTALVDGAKKSRTKPGAGSPVVPGRLPQVNLLPDSVRAVHRLRELRGWFGLAVLIAIVVVVAGWLIGMMTVSSAQDDLTSEQARTGELLAEKAQYATVTPVMAEQQRVLSSLLLASGGEVLWADYVDALAQVLPENVSVRNMNVAYWADGKTPSDPLVTPGIAQLTVNGVASGVPDVAALADGLAAVPGFSDPRITLVQRNSDQVYDITVSVQVTTEALSLRFMAEEQ